MIALLGSCCRKYVTRYYDYAGSAVTATSRFNESLTYADARGNIGTLKRQGGTLAGSCWNFGQIDNLSYTYTAGTNKIKTISDATGNAKGFKPGAGGDYLYDSNGNMTTDPHKGMTVQYNHLNLPTLVNMGSNKTITNLYDADGAKLRMTVNNNGTVTTRDYLDGIEYNGGTLESIYHLEGRVFNNSGTFRYEYTITDHLGNTRLTFTDKNGNGIINVTNTSSNEILFENNYYPFGLSFEGPWMNDAGVPDERYQYNGIERVNELGVNLDMAIFRANDPAIGRWWQVDPMAGIAPGWTPYRFGFDNPILNSDPLGLFESRDEAKRYKREHDVKGKVRKQSDGSYAIENKKEHSSYQKDSESGEVFMAALVIAPKDGPTGLLIPKRKEPYVGFFGGLEFLLTGGIDGPYKYNRDGYVIGQAPIAGTVPVGPGRLKSISSLEGQIAKHQSKLAEYIKDPLKFDNKGFLKNAPSEAVRQKIIQSRINHLNQEIQTFQNNIQKILNGQ